MLTKSQKVEIVRSLKENLTKAEVIILVDFKGLKVSQLNEIRRTFRDETITYKVYRNTLIRKSLEDVEFEGDLSEALVGNTGVVYSLERDPIETIKAVADVSKKFKAFKVKAAIFEGTLFDSKGFKELTKLPTKDMARGLVVGAISAPAREVVGIFNSTVSSMVWLLDAKIKKEQE
jgi:large subunit ribosomal protein L10